jgi:hypothetical protein
MSPTSTTTASSTTAELLPGYYVEPDTGAWLSLPWPKDLRELPTSLGPQIIAWCEEWLVDYFWGGPWRFTRGQKRFIHMWYALAGVDGDRPRWLYRSGVKRGAKGTGKDPLLAALALAELCGPTLPVWKGDRWVGESRRLALVQIAANSERQAKDPLKVANAMVNADMAAHFGFDKGKTMTQLAGGSAIEVLTKSEASAEGDPATAVFLNESHHMTESNGGQSLAAVGRRNAGKSPGGLARVLEFTNTHMPGEGSVAEDSFEAWQAQVFGKARKEDILYDSREAPPHLSLHNDEQLMQGLRAAYADAEWSDLERIRDEALDPRVPLADSIRFYFSSLPTAEDAYVDPRKFDAKVKPDRVVEHGEAIALFLDCSKSTDATTLDACCISDGHCFSIRGWQKPHGERGKGWLAPREQVDAEVRGAFDLYDVQWFGVDPSPAKDDEDEALYWAELIDDWHRDFRDKVLVWATPGEKAGSAVKFDMRFSTPGGRDRVRQLTEEAERTAAAIEEDSPTEPFSWDGSPMVRQHFHNARRRPNQFGVSIGKRSRSSSKLVDHAVSTVGARLGRRLILNSGKRRRRKRSGRVHAG